MEIRSVIGGDEGRGGGVSVDLGPFRDGEQVLAFHGSCLYDAKVQKAELQEGEWRYYVHYPGWNKKWDEWLGADKMLKRTEENIEMQKKIREKHEMVRTQRLLQGKKRKHENDGKRDSDKLTNIQIPPSLKTQLVDDNECITHLGQLIRLPCSPTVQEILDKYLDHRAKKDGRVLEGVEEMVKGIQSLFDKALPMILLYKQERQQYEQVITDGSHPSIVYGAQHLLRLFVKIPELLVSIQFKTETLMELHQRFMDFLRFLQINESAFFQSN